MDKENRKYYSPVKETAFKVFVATCAVFGICAMAVIVVYLLASGIPAITEIGFFDFLFGTEWNPSGGSFGILPMIYNTLVVTALSAVFGVVVGIFAAVFISRFCPKKLKKVLVTGVNLLSGIPSVVFGFFGLQFIVPFLGNFSEYGAGYGVLASGLVLGIMILPTVISISLNSLNNVPDSYYEGALGLGCTHSRAVFYVIVPAAKHGIASSCVLGVTRAIGETMAVIMVCGNSARFATSFVEAARTMTANIVAEMGYATGLHRNALIATGVALMVFVLIVTLSFNLLSGRKKKIKNKSRKLEGNLTANVEYRVCRRSSAALKAVSAVCMGLTVGALLFITVYILVMGLPNIDVQLLFGVPQWGGEPTILHAFVATLEMMAIALPISVVLGVGAAIFMSEYAKRGSRFVRAVRLCLETLSGVPSIVYGLFGMLVFCELMGMGTSILAASFTLAIMILPTMVRTIEESLHDVPDSYRMGGFALGAGRLRVIFKLVLPRALPGIITGIILGMGRILGESAVILYTAGSTFQMPSSPMSSAPSLALYIYLLSSEGYYKQQAYGAACIVMILAVVLNLMAASVETIAARLTRKKTERAKRQVASARIKEEALCSNRAKV